MAIPKQHNSSYTKRKLAAVLFADIVGYSAAMQRDEAKARILLQKFQIELKSQVTGHGGQIANFYGDGCLAIFESAIEAVICAEKLQYAFRQTPIVPVRIGLHSGDVFFEGDNVFGDSVNIASRIESMGEAGAVLFSGSVHRHIKNQKDFQTVALGVFSFKNIDDEIPVFALANEGLNVPESTALPGKLRKPSGIPSSGQKWLPLAGIVGLILLTFLLFNYFSADTVAIPTQNDKSIAVLPFRNDSNEAENEYFCNGIMEDVLTQLQKIGDLKVISRSSVMPYKKDPKPIRVVGQELGVAYVLEGSVRKLGGKVLITAQLIDAKEEGQVWAERYDRELSTENIFEVQANIAREIAKALQTNISPSEQARLDKKPTENLAAYDYYLRGLDYYRKRTFGEAEKQLFLALEMFEEARKLDSSFAMVYLRMGFCHDHLYWFGYDRSTERAALAKKYYDKAIALSPDEPEIIAGRGWYYYHIERDYEKAIDIFKQLIREHPHYSGPFNAMGVISARLGNWEAAEDYFEKALERNPNYQQLLQNAGLCYLFQRKYNKADSLFGKVLKLTSDDASGYDFKATIMVAAKGDVKGALELVKKSGVDMQEFPNFVKVGLKSYNGNFQEALQSLLRSKSEIPSHKTDRLGLFHSSIAQIYHHMQEPQMVRLHADSARVYLLSAIETSPDDSRLYAALGKAYSFLGQKVKAIEYAEQAVSIMPRSKDAYQGYYMELNLAETLVLTGNHQAALDKLQHLLSIPGMLTNHILRLDPIYRPLRSNPRFQQMARSMDFLD